MRPVSRGPDVTCDRCGARQGGAVMRPGRVAPHAARSVAGLHPTIAAATVRPMEEASRWSVLDDHVPPALRADLEERLWQTRRIQLLPLRRKNEKRQWSEEIRQILGRVRHQVETVFSVASTVFNLERPRGRSLAGHVVRIATIILAHTLSFFM